MKPRRLLLLLTAFTLGALLAAALGGAAGVFDRGPSRQDVIDAREQGAAQAQASIAVRMQAQAQDREAEGYQRGRESSEWLSLDRLPNPDGWFHGVMQGREFRRQTAAEAYLDGFAEGELQGRDEAVGARRERD